LGRPLIPLPVEADCVRITAAQWQVYYIFHIFRAAMISLMAILRPASTTPSAPRAGNGAADKTSKCNSRDSPQPPQPPLLQRQGVCVPCPLPRPWPDSARHSSLVTHNTLQIMGKTATGKQVGQPCGQGCICRGIRVVILKRFLQ